jgi:hypothetical protein
MEKSDNLVGREHGKSIKVGGGKLGLCVAGGGGGNSEEESAGWNVGIFEKLGEVFWREVEGRDEVFGFEGGGRGGKEEYEVCDDD